MDDAAKASALAKVEVLILNDTSKNIGVTVRFVCLGLRMKRQ